MDRRFIERVKRAAAAGREHPPATCPQGTSSMATRRRSLVSIDDVGIATAFLAHDAARLITGETLYIDGSYHIIDSLASVRSNNRRGRPGARSVSCWHEKVTS
jgi:hypothetical protein